MEDDEWEDVDEEMDDQWYKFYVYTQSLESHSNFIINWNKINESNEIGWSSF